MLKIRQEIQSFSKWFKVIFFAAFTVYILLWVFSVHLSSVQKSRGLLPLLPGAPKDSEEYILLSESLISGSGLSMNGKIETLRGIVYPLFVASIKTAGRSYFAVTFVQILFVFGSALMVRRIGMIFSSKSAGELAAALLLLNPVSVALALLILTDTLFLFLFTFGFYKALLLQKEKWGINILVVSFLFAIAIYVRGMGIFALPIFIAPILPCRLPFKFQIKSAAVMLCIIIISVLPWVFRNYIRTGVPAWNSFESVNLSWIVPKFLSSKNGTPEAVEIKKFQESTGVPQSAWQDLSWHDIRYSKQINAVGEKKILQKPFSYLKFHLITSLPFLFPSTILFARDVYNSVLHEERPFEYGGINALASGDFKVFYNAILKVWWKFAERILWLIGLLIALYEAWGNRRNHLTWAFVFTIGYLMLLSGPAAGPRLSFQAWPYMFILFASGLTRLYQKFISKNI